MIHFRIQDNQLFFFFQKPVNIDQSANLNIELLTCIVNLQNSNPI